MTLVSVELGERRYEVRIEHGLLGRAHEHLAPFARGGRLIVVSDENVWAAQGARLSQGLGGIEAVPIIMPPGEGSKSWPALADLVERPRTSPYGFSGHGPDALAMLREVGDELELPVVTEVMDTADLDLVVQHADALQIGARNMQNVSLLRAVGKTRKPVILKRGMSARIEELLLAAEYLLAAGNDQVVLCERGIRTFETATRNTLDLNAIPYMKQRTHLPVIVDPSHGTGVRDLVIPMSLAAAACGADGLLVEVHENPAVALSDGAQSLYPNQFAQLMERLGPVARAVGRSFP